MGKAEFVFIFLAVVGCLAVLYKIEAQLREVNQRLERFHELLQQPKWLRPQD